MKFHAHAATLATLAGLLWSAGPVFADFGAGDKGTSSGLLLKLPVGARGAAMGEAQTAAVGDATAIFWNPAGLMRVEGQTATLMHAELINGVAYEFLGYGRKLRGERGALGVGLQYLTAPSISETDAAGFETGAGFGPRDTVVSLSYARKLPLRSLEGYEFGVTGKYIDSHISRTASAYAGDFGFLSPLYRLEGRPLRLGLFVQNLGEGLKFDQEAQPLPQSVRLGASLGLTRRWLLAVDLNHPRDNAAYAAFGVEYKMKAQKGWSFAGRAGLNTRGIGEVGGLSGVSLGLGAGSRAFGLDYALVPMGSLGLTHRISLTVPLSPGKPAKTPDE